MIVGDFDEVRVFSATKARERTELGDKVTDWIKTERPIIKKTEVLQSSDHEFHCLSIVVFYDKQRAG